MHEDHVFTPNPKPLSKIQPVPATNYNANKQLFIQSAKTNARIHPYTVDTAVNKVSKQTP